MQLKKIIIILGQEIRIWIEDILNKVPGKTGNLLRGLYWKHRMGKCSFPILLSTGIIITNPRKIFMGKNVKVMQYSKLYANDRGIIKIGNNVSINTNVQLGAGNSGEIIIGNDVLIASNVVIRASNHVFDKVDVPIWKQGHSGGRIVIEDDVWIASNAVILPNVTIRKGAIVAAGAVVTKDVASYQVVAGIPAKTIKIRK